MRETIRAKKTIALAALAAVLVTIAVPAQARAWRHWRHPESVYPAYERSYSNQLSSQSFIYPTANWDIFFHHVRHYGPLVYLPPAIAEAEPAVIVHGPAVSALY